jgi:sulfite exporter TauE/SafE
MRVPGPGGRFLFGLCSGLLPCGLVYATIAVPVASADPRVGAGAMLAFGLGTVPALAFATLAFRRLLTGGLWRRRLLAAAVLVAGLGAVAMRAPTESGEPACHGR